MIVKVEIFFSSYYKTFSFELTVDNFSANTLTENTNIILEIEHCKKVFEKVYDF